LKDVNKIPSGFLALKNAVREQISGRLSQELFDTDSFDLPSSLKFASGLYGTTTAIAEASIKFCEDMTGSGSIKLSSEDKSLGTETVVASHGALEQKGRDRKFVTKGTEAPGSGEGVRPDLISERTSGSLGSISPSSSDIEKNIKRSPVGNPTERRARDRMSKNPMEGLSKTVEGLQKTMMFAASMNPGALLPQLFNVTRENYSDQQKGKKSFFDEAGEFIDRSEKVLDVFDKIGVNTGGIRDGFSKIDEKLDKARRASHFIESGSYRGKLSGSKILEMRGALQDAIGIFTDKNVQIGTNSEAEALSGWVDKLAKVKKFEKELDSIRGNVSGYESQFKAISEATFKSHKGNFSRMRETIESMRGQYAHAKTPSQFLGIADNHISQMRSMLGVIGITDKSDSLSLTKKIDPKILGKIDFIAKALSKESNSSVNNIKKNFRLLQEQLKRAKSGNPKDILKIKDQFKIILEDTKGDLKKIGEEIKGSAGTIKNWRKIKDTDVSRESAKAISKFNLDGIWDDMKQGNIASAFTKATLQASKAGEIIDQIKQISKAAKSGSGAIQSLTGTAKLGALADVLTSDNPDTPPNINLSINQITALSVTTAYIMADMRRLSLETSRRIMGLGERVERTRERVKLSQLEPLKRHIKELKRAFKDAK